MRTLLRLSAILAVLTAMLLAMPSAQAIVYTYPDGSQSEEMPDPPADLFASSSSRFSSSSRSSSSRSSVSSVSSASSVSSPYPYFRRTGDAATTQTSSVASPHPPPSPAALRLGSGQALGEGAAYSVSSGSSPSTLSYISDVPKVGVSLESDRSEANPGDDVRYWIKVRNLYTGDMPQWKIAFFFDRHQMQIIDASSARGEGDHLTFIVPPMRSNEEVTFTVRVRLKNLKPGTVVRTYGSMIWDGQISPACSKNDLVIIARPPVTGIGDYTAPVEDLAAFLRPVSAASKGSPMPLITWGTVAIAGLGVGGRLGKKFM